MFGEDFYNFIHYDIRNVLEIFANNIFIFFEDARDSNDITIFVGNYYFQKVIIATQLVSYQGYNLIEAINASYL